MKLKTFSIAVALFFAGCNLFAQNTYVPDDYFEMALIALGYDSGELNDSVATGNINSITALNVHERNISDLTGIEDFIALEYLSCVNNKISKIDISNNVNLDFFDCTHNQLTDLDVSKNLNLTYLNCGENQLETIDLSQNRALKRFSCYNNKITSINLDSNQELERLICQYNEIEVLDVSKNIKLIEIDCLGNKLRKLNLRNGNNYYMDVDARVNPELFCIQVDNPVLSAGYAGWRKDQKASYSEDCENFKVEMTYIPDDNFEQALIDLGYDSGPLNDSVLTSNINTLTILDVSNKQIDSLEGIQDFKSLKSLIFDNNNLTNINISNNTELTYLTCDNNSLTSLDVSNNQKLTILRCYNNNISELDLTALHFLISLDCSKNRIPGLDLSNNSLLEFLSCGANLLTELDVSNNISLEDLLCSNNLLKTLLIGNNSNIYRINCFNNKIEELDVSNCPVLRDFDCHQNNLKSLNIKNGNNHNMTSEECCNKMFAYDNPNLFCIEADNPCGYESWRVDDHARVSIDCSRINYDVQTACDSYTWIDGNVYTSSNNTATTIITSSGCDSLVTLDLTIEHSTYSVDVQTACDSYKWIDGKTYTKSNYSATHILTNAAGCDSVITLDLTILKSASRDIQTACDSFKWIDGKTYTESNNSATFKYVNAAGCDSIVTLDLTILKSGTGVDIQTACDSFKWIDGKIYTENNNSATYTLVNAAGCDSIVTLDLTILSSGTGVDIQTVCDSFTWIDGKTYTESNNTATYALTNAAGCDSIVTLDLTILKSSTGTDFQTACDFFEWIDGKTYTESNNTATYALTNAAGCDSIVTLGLTILKSSTGVDIQTACDSFTWIDGKTYTESNNSATYTLVNAAGCDSTVSLDLTVVTINKSLAINDSSIISVQSGASYQWLDCDDNYEIISGANSQSYNISKSGNYSVEISLTGCVDTTDCIGFNLVGIYDINFSKVKIYPNPNNGMVNIQFGGLLNPDIRVLTPEGKLVYEQEKINSNEFQFKLDVAAGIYYIEINAQHKKSVFKLVKK